LILRVEIADSPSKLEKGLMFRKYLDQDEGMLFIFRSEQDLRFWGQNTYIPLDIAFVDKEMKIIKISDIKPLSTKIVSSDIDCLFAIETNLGYFSKNKISKGDQIKIETERDGQRIIKFIKDR
jgi:hypothetical protein